MTWKALNIEGQPYGAPDIDYERFAARWESDPIIKKLVSRFDGRGLVVNTTGPEDQTSQGEPEKSSGIEQMAKRATANAFK
jgi:hypothetical protein